MYLRYNRSSDSGIIPLIYSYGCNVNVFTLDKLPPVELFVLSSNHISVFYVALFVQNMLENQIIVDLFIKYYQLCTIISKALNYF